MEINQVPLEYSNLLLRHIVFEVVSHIVNLTEDEAKKSLYRYLNTTLKPMDQPFNPNRTEGVIVHQMMSETTDLSNPTLQLDKWKELESTNQSFSIAVHSIIVRLIELVNGTRGFIKSIIQPTAEDIANQIVKNRLAIAPFSEENPPVDPYFIIGSVVKDKAFPAVAPTIEMVSWGELENITFLSSVMSDVKTMSGLHLEGSPSKEWLPQLLSVCRAPLVVSEHPDTVLKNAETLRRILTDITGEADEGVLNILAYPSAYKTLVSIYENAIFTAPAVFEMLDRVQVLKNIGGQVLTHPHLPENLKPHIASVMYRLDVMLLGIQCARASVFGKSYILAALREEGKDGYALLINSDQEYTAKEMDVTPTNAYDVFLYWIFEHKRLFPANGLETSYVAEKKDKAINWVLAQAIEASKRQQTNIDHIHRQAAYPALLKGLHVFLQKNGINKGVGELEPVVNKGVEYMEMYPEKATLVIMELLLHFTPYEMAKTLCGLYTSYSDVTKMPVSSMEAILAEFVRVILIEKLA